jgi:hypothetical protein
MDGEEAIRRSDLEGGSSAWLGTRWQAQKNQKNGKIKSNQEEDDHMVWVRDTSRLFGYKISYCSCGEPVEVSSDDEEITISNELHVLEHYWRDQYFKFEDLRSKSPLDLFYSSISDDLAEFDLVRRERVDSRLDDIAGEVGARIFYLGDAPAEEE